MAGTRATDDEGSRTAPDRDAGDEASGRRPGTAEKAMMALSFLFTVALLSYVGWQVVAGPASAPEPSVQVAGTETLSDGRVAVTVELRNQQDRGLIAATVESRCTSPPASVQFTYVPADATQTGTLVCPPGTENPQASVTSWVEA